MKIAGFDIYPLSLPMKQSFFISGGNVGVPNAGAPHVYIKITDEDGTEGWGEARPSHRWSYETIETVVSTLNVYVKPAIMELPVQGLQTILSIMNREIAGGIHPGQPIAKAAVEMAIFDLIGKQSRKRLPELWMSSYIKTIRLSYLISTKDPVEAAAKARFAAEEGYCGIDLKIGLDLQKDFDILAAVRQNAPNMYLRVDANQAYTLQQAVKVAQYMERIGVDVFEQPLPANDLFGHAQLRRKTNVPIALDESIWTPRDLLQAIRAEACDAAVIKLTKMGGLTGAKLCGEIAAESGLTLLGGGLTESGLALTASSHLFHYLLIESPVDLNGPIFLQDDPLEYGPFVERGTVVLPDGYGIGCSVSEEKLSRYKREVLY